MSEKLRVCYKFLTDFHKPIISATAIIGTILTLIILLRSCQTSNDVTYSSKRPNVRIKSVSIKQIPYNGSDVALRFYIPIKNEGDATAYDIEIKKKVLSLIRGTFDLTFEALQSPLTRAAFDLKKRAMVEDTIFIDENATLLQQVMSGEKSIFLDYVIYYYANNKKTEPYIYEYKAKFSKGEFQVLSENLRFEVKP